MNKAGAKEVILSAVVDMLGEGKAAEELTVREIAKRAEVGIGLINYHYQTKENLIDLAVQRYVDDMIGRTPVFTSELAGTAKQKIKVIAKMILGNIARNPSVARITILRDMSAPAPGDSIEKIMKVFDPYISEITGGDPYWSQLILSLFCFTFQSTFLRANVLGKNVDFDFFSERQRNQFVDDVVETVLHDII